MMPNLPGLVRDNIARLELCLNEMKYALGLNPSSEGGSKPFQIEVDHVLRVLAARRIRVQQLGADLVADPAWDLLLQSFAAGLAGTTTPVTNLCRGTPVPESTSVRWIKKLEDDGWFERLPAQDGEPERIKLTPDGSLKLRRYFEAVGPILLLI